LWSGFPELRQTAEPSSKSEMAIYVLVNPLLWPVTGHIEVVMFMKTSRAMYSENRPLFRVGDRVKVTSPGIYCREQGLIMEVTQRNGNDVSYRVRFPEWKTATFSETELTLV
jgi:hypothetical protein